MNSASLFVVRGWWIKIPLAAGFVAYAKGDACAMRVCRGMIPLFAILTITISNGQVPTPAPSQSQSIVIRGGTAHIGNGQVIENSVIRFENGKITFVGTTGEFVPDDNTKIIDATGKHVYPGLIAANTTIGLTEIDAVRATADFSETGDLNPNARSIIAYNTDSKIIPTVRSNGVLLAQVRPQEAESQEHHPWSN